MSSTYGEKIKISVFGESHGNGIGVVIDGLPAGVNPLRAIISPSFIKLAASAAVIKL